MGPTVDEQRDDYGSGLHRCEHGRNIGLVCEDCITDRRNHSAAKPGLCPGCGLDGRNGHGECCPNDPVVRMAKGPIPQGRLPSDAKARKGIPVATGCLDYFPDALAAVAHLSKIGNDKHNPGQPLHWSRGKSNDHPDCLIRHFLERGTVDTSGAEPVLHSTQMAWRALAILQLEIEATREVRS